MKALAFTVAATVDLEEICNYTECEWGQVASGPRSRTASVTGHVPMSGLQYWHIRL
ncbi:hypothetical protein [Paracoccus sp. TOH]|uniref:hypothetical protein n=1 Tax=Paracoccus sp. TOH TaxID=1263728 RepID=UPI0025B0FBB2|nr:hypothetical protein [Paracoccus sp. TOH]WJS85451.1 hypothetical protein NBE95_14905 [Paracoccus sp. TOH]